MLIIATKGQAMIARDAFVDKMSAQPILQDLERAVLETIYEQGEFEACRRGHIILNENDEGRGLFFLLKGQVNVFLPKQDFRISEISLTELGPGNSVGEYSLVDRKPASASVRALTDIEIFKIGKDDFLAIIEAEDKIAKIVYRNLLRVLISRCRESNTVLDIFTIP